MTHVMSVLFVAGLAFAAGAPVVGFLAIAAAGGLIVFYVKLTAEGGPALDRKEEA